MKVFVSFIFVISTVLLGLTEKKETSVTLNDSRKEILKNNNRFGQIYRVYSKLSQNTVVKTAGINSIYPNRTFENQFVSIIPNMFTVKESNIAFKENTKSVFHPDMYVLANNNGYEADCIVRRGKKEWFEIFSK